MMRVMFDAFTTDVQKIIKHLHCYEKINDFIIRPDDNLSREERSFIDQYNLSLYTNQEETGQIDYLFRTCKNESALLEGAEEQIQATTIVPSFIYSMFSKLMNQSTEVGNEIAHKINEMMLQTVHDGIISVNRKGIIEFMNERAKNIVDVHSDVLGVHIREVIPYSQLPNAMEKGKKEFHKHLRLQNGKKIMTTRMPVRNDRHEVVAAFAVFKDITEVDHLSEENTELKHVKMMLEATILSSADAISVVDHQGLGLMINRAYTKITGLTEDEIIGKPASTDIYEGTSVHDHVLKTGQNVRNVEMKVGIRKTDVIVNAAPIIVDEEIVGSVAVIQDLSALHKLSSQLQKANKQIRALQAKYTFIDIIGESTEIMIAREQAKIGARTPATVLLRGASGTGKELFAHAIHNESDLRDGPFIRVNCAAITPTLIESELFGYVDGAFSGARIGGKRGLFEEAHRGSIFLDEIGELSPSVQAKLLRVLQEKEIIRVGGVTPIAVDVRVIAATNKHLEKEIGQGTFREDLYYRLNRLPIFIPSLRERIVDLPLIVSHLIDKMNTDYGRNVEGITEQAIGYLKQFPWNGNIRELENRIGRAMIYMDYNEKVIDEHHVQEGWSQLPYEESKQTSGDHTYRLKDGVAAFEKEFIARIYREHKFVKTRTAEALGISIRSLYNKLDKYGIQ